MAVFSKLKFRMCTIEDANKLVEHINRGGDDAWRDGDAIYGFGSEEPFDEGDWRKGFNENQSRSLRTPGWTRNLVVTDGDDIVGGVNLRTEDLRSSQHRASLGIALEKTYRGQGLGRRLMEMIIEWARSQTELEWIDLGVFATNPKAQLLYKSLGFVEWGRCTDRFRVDGSEITDISMSLKLHP